MHKQILLFPFSSKKNICVSSLVFFGCLQEIKTLPSSIDNAELDFLETTSQKFIQAMVKLLKGTRKYSRLPNHIFSYYLQRTVS